MGRMWNVFRCYITVVSCILCVLTMISCSRQIPLSEMFETEKIIMTESEENSAVAFTEQAFVERAPLVPEHVLAGPRDSEFVCVREYIPSIFVELVYGSAGNFTGQQIYSFSDAWLRYGTVRKLAAVCEELEKNGLYLKIWDGFRPVSSQFILWEVYPDSNFVANPNQGFSAHSRGNTVDVTLVDAQGSELEMPTGFDDFSSRADRDYSDCTDTAANNTRLLESVMEKYGFQGYWGEWWHYTDTDSYDVETCFDPGVLSVWYADCEEFITLREWPNMSAPEITKIPAGEAVTLLGYIEEFAYVQYHGQRGYVLERYIGQHP